MPPVICGRCGTLTTANARRCPQCGRFAPGLFGLRPFLIRLFSLDADFAKTTALVLVVAYFASVLYAQRIGDAGEGLLGRFTPGNRTFWSWGELTPWSEIVTHGEYWRLVTVMFLHFGPIHILLNALGVLQLGRLVTEAYGPARYVVLFVLSGIGASLASRIWDPEGYSVGASGAVFGLLGALLGYGFRRGGFAGEQIRNMALQGFLYAVVYSLVIPRIDHAAHIGGALTGLALAWGFNVHQLQRGREADVMLLLGLACLLLVLACIGLCAFTFFTRDFGF